MVSLMIAYTDDENGYEMQYALSQLVKRARTLTDVQLTVAGEDRHPTAIGLSGAAGAVRGLFDFFYTDADAVKQAAENIEFRAYRARVESAVADIKGAIALGNIEDEDDLREWVDNESEVIYFSDANTILRCTRNEDAYAEEMGSEPANECVRASFALQADIYEELDADDIDALIDALRPLTESDKEDLRAYIEDDEDPLTAENRDDLFERAAEDIRTSEEGLSKAVAYLEATYPPTP